MRVCERVFSVGLVPDWTQCLPQAVGAPPAMLRGRTAGFPKKLGGRRGGIGGYNLHSPPDCGTPTTCRLYPFGVSDRVELPLYDNTSPNSTIMKSIEADFFTTGYPSWCPPFTWDAVSNSPRYYIPAIKLMLSIFHAVVRFCSSI